MTARRVFIDTNVLLRATIVEADHHSECHAALENLDQQECELWISRQVLREYAATLTRPQRFGEPLAPSVIADQIQGFEERYQVADETAVVTARLLELLQAVAVGGKQVHDANIIATMRANEVSELLTLNITDFTRFTAYITLLSVDAALKPSTSETTDSE